MNHAESFFAAAAQICRDISLASIENLASELDRLRDRKGRLFLIGVGGSAELQPRRQRLSKTLRDRDL
jgi:D-sedoheptulose 7-phosphate isomerase